MTTSPAPTGSPDLTMFYVLHRAMLDDAARLAAAVAAARGPDRERRLPALVRWYGGYLVELHDHHTVEDEIFFPALARRVAEFAGVAGRLADDHDRLDGALERTRQALAALADPGNGWAAPHAEAADATCELEGLLRDHLAFENSGVVPLYARHFTAGEYAELEERTREHLTAANLRFTLPWLAAAATGEERAGLMAKAPLSFKLLLHASKGRYRRMARRAFGGAAAPDAADAIAPGAAVAAA